MSLFLSIRITRLYCADVVIVTLIPFFTSYHSSVSKFQTMFQMWLYQPPVPSGESESRIKYLDLIAGWCFKSILALLEDLKKKSLEDPMTGL